jgi:hypothetical protein
MMSFVRGFGAPWLILVGWVALSCANGGSTIDETTGPGAGGGGGGGEGGESSAGLPLGSPCVDDSECASEICREVFFDLPDKVCVGRCASQDDCPEGDGFFCEAITNGAVDGYCIPRSPAHCVSCENNSDCGYFTEVCLQGPNDDQHACHIDCSLSGAAACPTDYTCESLTLGNTTRQLCVPVESQCADAVGGFCDDVMGPLVCARQNADGECLGERACDATTMRFSACGAAVPQCKASCDDPDPAGCMLESCGGAADTVDHCGMCNNPCPGIGTLNGAPSCIDATCGFDCQGETYDVDGNINTGCEKSDAVVGNHTQGTGVYVGSFGCGDGSSNRNISGSLHSDMRNHIPAITGFDAASGSAPDWFNLFADGGAFCQNEVVLTLNATGTGNLACYRLTVYTNNGTHTCTTNASGTCLINQDGTGVYSDNTTIHIRVDKVCAASAPGAVTYTVTGHL